MSDRCWSVLRLLWLTEFWLHRCRSQSAGPSEAATNITFSGRCMCAWVSLIATSLTTECASLIISEERNTVAFTVSVLFPQFTCRHHDGIISRQSVSSNSFNRWASHGIFLFKYRFLLHILRFLFFFSDNIWPIWLANSKRQPYF
jgi:hypothetical protein